MCRRKRKTGVAALRGTCFITKPLDLNEFLKIGTRSKQLALEGKEDRARAAP